MYTAFLTEILKEGDHLEDVLLRDEVTVDWIWIDDSIY
jgi:hypothetical protein